MRLTTTITNTNKLLIKPIELLDSGERVEETYFLFQNKYFVRTMYLKLEQIVNFKKYQSIIFMTINKKISVLMKKNAETAGKVENQSAATYDFNKK